MTEEEQLLKKRLTELSRRADGRSTWTYSDFLNIAQQDVLMRIPRADLPAPYELIGGYDAAERRLAAFGSIDLCGYECAPPCVWVEIKPTSQKFADALSHRDVLGSLMSLGLKRGTMGDIILADNIAYVYCATTASEVIMRELTRVKHTSVSTSLCEKPECAISEPSEQEIVVSSPRLDSILSAVYKISRSDSKDIFAAGKVYLNARVCSDASKEPKCGDVISVRGLGRVEYVDIARETKKGRLRVSVKVYK